MYKVQIQQNELEIKSRERERESIHMANKWRHPLIEQKKLRVYKNVTMVTIM